MKIKSSEGIRDLRGEYVKDPEGKVFSIGKALANILVESKVGGKAKMYVMATDFYKEKTMDYDEADIAIIRSAIQSDNQYNNLVTGQLLMILENSPEQSSEPVLPKNKK
jgi:hypothetical protein